MIRPHTGRLVSRPHAVAAILLAAVAAFSAPNPQRAGGPLPADASGVTSIEGARVREGGSPGTAVPVETNGEDESSVRAAAESIAAGGGPEFVKGWVEAMPGGRLEDLPAGSRTIESYGERLFVEIPVEAASSMAARGLHFQSVPEADTFGAGDQRFDAGSGEPAFPIEWSAGPPASSKRPYLVKFDAPVKPEWLSDLEAAGMELVQYQPTFGYLVFAPPGVETRLKGVRHLAFNGEYHAAYKAAASLRARAAQDGTFTIRLVLFDLPGWEKRVDALTLTGGRLMELDEGPSTSQWAVLHHAVIENVHTRDLPDILRDPRVYWAEEWFPPQTEDERSAQITAGNINLGQPTTGYHAWLAGLGADGTGVTVTVADTGLDNGSTTTQHGDFRTRTTYATGLCANNRDTDGHGTNTSSIAIGDPRLPNGTGLLDSGSFFWGAGSAPGAILYFQKALNNGDCPASYAGSPNTLAQDAVTNGGAEIGSHSFQDGLTPGSGYTSTCAVWDARVRDADMGLAGNQPYSVVFSAGNSGPSASSLTSPHAAKNIISVGATENYHPGQCPGAAGCGGPADDIDALVDFSSRGPTVDNRIKPDIAAPGHVIAGARSSIATYDCFCDPGGGAGCCAATGVDGSNKYSVYSGTSQAAPRVGGASAIVYDWFKDRFSVFPSPAMNKAILINGATDMKTLDVPNNNEGWGRVNLRTSLQNSLPSTYVDQTTIIGGTGDPNAFTASYFVQDPSKPMKATLVWTDAPGAMSCNPCLVNDLDLFVTQSATTWRGNNFTNGFTNTGAVADTRNNVEGINLAGGSLICASFQVKVRAQTLGGDGVPGNADSTDQDFALVVENAAATAGPPVLNLTSSTLAGGCDSDGFLDRRETATLTLQIGNPGCTAASGVQATLSLDSAPAGASVSVSPTGAESIGTIASGGSASHAWQVSLADNAGSFCGQKVRFRIDLTDGAARSWTQFAEVVLDTNSFSTVTSTDPATVDNSFSKDPDEWHLAACRTTSSPTSWHMGQTDCSGIVRDASTRDLVFAYTLSSGDVIKEMNFRHAFNGYRNSDFTLTDSVEVGIDPENDGTFVTLQSWQQGINNPTTMTLAGPYDLTPYNAARAATIKIRFRFASAANWVGGQNSAAGWDVDDIVFKKDSIVCDGGSCPICGAPSGLTNNTAADSSACFTTGVNVTWSQNPASWNDAGGTRTYTVLRDGAPVASGPCSGTIPFGTTSCTDTTAAGGVAYTYQVRYTNGCSQNAATTGVAVTDSNCAPSPVGYGSGGNPLMVNRSGSDLVLTWDPVSGATRYNIYVGSMPGFWNHAIFTAAGLNGANSCFEPTNSATFAMPGGSVYFLISADNGTAESTLGDTTARPYASPPCSPH